MATQVAPSGSAASTTRQLTAEQISKRSDNKLSCHLLFFHELNGGRNGNGHVPQDSAARGRYFEGVRRFLMREYGLTPEGLAQLRFEYSQNNGPGKVRAKLIELSKTTSSPQPA